MSRQRTEINPIRAERVKTLIDREKITQKELADMIFQSQQNISRIVQQRQPLTEETAQDIIRAANRIVDEKEAAQAGITLEEYGSHITYRVQWLLGYDDMMTVNDESDRILHAQNAVADSMWAIIERSLNKQGKSLRFVHRQGQHPDAIQRLHADCYYTIVDNDGKVIKKLTALEMAQFESQIQDYCDFMVERHL